MNPQIVEANQKKLIGIRRDMSLFENTTSELWREFLPRANGISDRVGNYLFSLQNYPTGYFSKFDPKAQFEKWAAVEVTSFDHIPENMEPFVLAAGLFAVFHYVGSSAEAPKVFQFIYGHWLPKSDFLLDERPHFEILGEEYKNNDPSSEEDIWIPVRRK